ncbi:MAG: TetR/AcrR family transcriptional regulator [Acidimicrobiales bacterium]
MSSESATPKRAYDATRRRERAEEERRATRNRVIGAATALFAERGYTATTMADIARVAGVSMQSVYSAGRSKADLLHAAVDLAVAGDDQEVLVHERPLFQAVAAEPDPARQVQMLADLICTIQERSEFIRAAEREGAAVEPILAEHLQAAHRRRYETFRTGIAMLPADRLRYSPEECTETAWAVASTDVFMLLRHVRGWTWAQILPWLARTLIDLLLVP